MKWRERMRANGKCPGCGKCPPKAGRKRCEKCLAKNRAIIRRAVERKRAAGICVRCGEPNPSDKNYCLDCRAKNTVYQRTRRQNFIADGRCARCGAQLLPGTGDGPIDCKDCFRNRRNRRRRRLKLPIDVMDDEHDDIDTPERLAIRAAALRKLGV